MSDALARFQTALQSQSMLEVSEAARALIKASPNLGSDWAGVASAALEAGDEPAALDAAKLLVKAAPDYHQSHVWVATALSAMGDHGGALAVLESQIARHPNVGELYRRAGRALINLGRPAAAHDRFKTALDLNGMDVQALEGIAETRNFKRGDDVLLAMEELRIGIPADASSRDRGVLSYALARAYDAIGDHEVAARRVGEAAAFYRESAPFETDRHEQAMDHIVATYDDRFTRANEEAGVVDARPVFVIAPPCTGAEWLAKTLCAADGVARLERRNALFWMAASPLGDHDSAALLRELNLGESEGLFTTIAHTYLARVGERLGRDVRRVIDPSALTEMAAGVMGLSLPAAKFIRLTRDPRDLAWAIYARRFRQGRNWSYHPDDIARVLACQNRLCERWDALFGERIHTLSYEALSEDPAAALKGVAGFIGVDAEAVTAEAWLRADALKADPVGVHARAGARFEPVEAALKRAGLV
ncbi:MAG: sulfotransferase [Oceanicaulis sp.]